MSDFPERDVKEFSFRQMSKLRVSDQPFPDDTSSVGRYNLIAVSNIYGITYVGCPTDLKVIQTAEMGKIHHSNTSGDINTIVDSLPMKRISIPCIHHLGLSCDELTLSVCYTREDGLALVMFDTRAFLSNDPKPPFCKTKLSTNKGVTVADVKWNPAHPNMLACLRSDGTLVILEVTDNNSMKMMANFDNTKGITAICWSPKGKQLVAGRQDGSFAQFTAVLQEKKSVPKPDIFGDSKAQVNDILWLSTYVFVVLYDVITDDASQPSLVVVSLPKKDEQRPTNFTNFEEICFGGGEDRDLKYFLHHVDEWGLVVCASSRSMEAAVIGKNLEDKNVWELWNLDDAARAELPLSTNHDETYPMGMAVDLTSTNHIPIGENQSLPPMPIFMLLSTDGLLCPFYMVNTAPPQPLTIIKPPTTLSAQGERQGPAQAASPAAAAKPVAPVAVQQPQPATAGKENTAPLPKPAAVPASTTFSFTQPQAPPAAAPTSSLFTAPTSTPKMGLQTTPSTTSGGLSLFGSAASSAAPKFGLPGASTTTSTGGLTIGGNSSAGFKFALPGGQQAGSSSAFSFSLPGSSQPGTTGGTSSQGFSFAAPGTTQPTAAPTGPGASAFSMAAPAGVSVKPAAVTSTTAVPAPGTTGATGLFSMPASTTVSSIAPAAPKTTGFGFGAPSAGQAFSFRPGTTTAQPGMPQSVSKPAVQPQQSGSVQPGSKPPSMVQASTLQPGNGPTQVVKPSAQQAKPVAVTQPAPSQPQPPPYRPPVTQPAAAVPARPAQPPAEEPGAVVEEDTFSASILDEISHFESEVANLREAAAKTDWKVGHPDELRKLKEETQQIGRFCDEIKDTTQSIHNDIHDLRTQTLETFAMLEEGKSRNDRNKEPYYHQLLRSQALDPASANKMKEVRQMYHYVDTTIRDVNNMLDDEWDKFKQQKSQKSGKLKSPALDVVYRAVSNHDKILHDQSQHIRKLSEQLKKMRLYNTTSSWTNRPVARSTTKTDTELSALADTLLHPRQDTTPERQKKSSSASPMSSKKQSQLRELLGKRQVTPVRSTTPASVSQSRLISPQRMYRASPRPASSTPRGREGDGLPTPPPPKIESPPLETPAGSTAQSRVKTVLQFSPPAEEQPLPLDRSQPVPMTTKPPEPAATKPVPSPSSGFAPVPFSQGATVLKGPSALTPKEAAAAAAMSRVGAANQQSAAFGSSNQKPAAFGLANQQPTGFGSISQAPATSSVGVAISQPASFGSSNQKPALFGSTNQQTAGFGSAIQQAAVSSTSNQQPLRFGATSQQSVLPDLTNQYPAGLGLANQLEAEDDLNDDGGSTEDVAPPVVNIKDVANLKPVSTGVTTAMVSDSVNRNALEAAQKILQSATATSKPATTTAAMSVPLSTSGFSFATPGQQPAFGQPANFGNLSTAPSTTAPQTSSTSMGSFVIGQGLSGSFSFKPAVTATLSSATQATQAQPKPVETKPTSSFSFSAPTGLSGLSFGQGTSSFGFGALSAASTTSTAAGATTDGSLLAKTLAEKPQDVKPPGSEQPSASGVEDITPPPTPEETPTSSTQVADVPAAPKPSFDFSKNQTEADTIQPGGFFLSPKSDTPPPEPPALSITSSQTAPTPTPATVVESKPTATATTTSLFGQSTTSSGFGFGLNTPSGFSALKPGTSSGFSFASPASSTAVTSASTTVASGYTTASPTRTTTAGTITTTAAGSTDSATTTAAPVQPSTTAPVDLTTPASAQPVAATTTTPAATTSEQPATTATTTTVSLFGPTTTNATTAGFGSAAQTTAASGGFLFGQQTTGGSTPAFGQPTTTATGTSGFGAASTTAGSSLFASTSGSSGSLFGQPAATTTTTSTSSFFGQPATAGSSGFGQSSSSGFGFGQTPTSGGLFGTATSSTANTGGLFGQTSTTPTGGLFGQSAFGSSTTTSSSGGGLFGSSSTTSTSTGLFGGGSTASTGGFFSGLGAKPSAEAASKNPFGGSTSFGTPSTSAASSLFGASPGTKAVGSTGFGTASSGGFGSPTSGGFSAGGSVAQQGFGAFSQPSQPQAPAASSGFGSPPSFGSTPAFGGSPGFGSTAAFSNPLGTSSQVFGSTPTGGGAFSQSSSAAPSFAANDAPTFGGIAAQSSGAPTFGGLAQGSPGFGGGGGGFGSPAGGFGTAAVFQQQPQQQQPQPGFGSSSGGFGQSAPSSQSSAFSSWR
ncbi:nuclear pore complex protein Nup214-like isoform X8 [Branchiostoma floridae]|uniref:Nuclear pore complex protein Nup214 n=1 Tax=Branchiostoma floridae TaxID=7739 RepID=A0A9J7HT34_BRAFL|nr:nuclear pore complex protein Nup214-like isoform X8 [Branchiostoma floridae]